MPLREHFRSLLDDVHSWDEVHGGWPMMIVRELIEVLPESYFAAPGVHLGTLYKIDFGTYGDPSRETPAGERPTTDDAPHLAQGNQGHLARTRIELRGDLSDAPNSLKR